jgi:hypothetical protein
MGVVISNNILQQCMATMTSGSPVIALFTCPTSLTGAETLSDFCQAVIPGVGPLPFTGWNAATTSDNLVTVTPNPAQYNFVRSTSGDEVDVWGYYVYNSSDSTNYLFAQIFDSAPYPMTYALDTISVQPTINFGSCTTT